MCSLVCRKGLSTIVTLILACSPCLTYSGEPQDRVGVQLGFNWNIGDVHPDQSRWQANFALGSTANLAQSMNATSSKNGGVNGFFYYERIDDYHQGPSLLPFQWSTNSMGESLAMLYGVPVVTRISTTLNSAGTASSSNRAIISSPWVWLGAAAVGLAATTGGGSSARGRDGGGSGSNSCGTNGGTLVGNGGAVNTDNPADPSGPSVGTGCVN